MEKEPAINPDQERLSNLADQLEKIMNEKTGGKGYINMEKLIRRLREGNAESAKIFLSNEADKFTEYREDALPLIIQHLYGGTGSPWSGLERKMKRV